MSGQAATLGLQAAIDDVNKAGGVLGRKLTLVIRDDLSQPPKSIQNMSDLIDNEKVVAVFGPTNSGNALAWKHIPTQKKIPVIGTVGSATAITYPVSAGAENYMFRVSMVDRDQVAGLMAYVKRTKTPRRRWDISPRPPVTDKAVSRTSRNSVSCKASSRFAMKSSESTTRT